MKIYLRALVATAVLLPSMLLSEPQSLLGQAKVAAKDQVQKITDTATTMAHKARTWVKGSSKPQQRTIYMVTGNKGKLAEFQAAFAGLEGVALENVNIDLEEIQETNPFLVIRAKIKQALDENPDLLKKGPFFVEDTSLYFDGLATSKKAIEKKATEYAKIWSKDAATAPDGLPGPLIKWFMDTAGNEGLYRIAQQFNNFGAEATAYVGYVDNPDINKIKYFKGSVRGTIVPPRAIAGLGFGWDPIFQPEGQAGVAKTFGEMTKAEKNQFSARGHAAAALRSSLETH